MENLKNKLYFLMFAAIVVLGTSYYNYKQIHNFMNLGERNTAEDGKHLCKHINILLAYHNETPIDCVTLYKH